MVGGPVTSTVLSSPAGLPAVPLLQPGMLSAAGLLQGLLAFLRRDQHQRECSFSLVGPALTDLALNSPLFFGILPGLAKLVLFIFGQTSLNDPDLV